MATREEEIKELQGKIKTLSSLGPAERERAGVYENELEALLAEAPTKGGDKVAEDTFEIPVTEEEWEKGGSKFAQAGNHLSEMGLPDWDTPGKSIAFPFTIIEDGLDKDKESKLSAGVGKEAVWKLKEILAAIGVEHTIVGGKVSFSKTECAGKQFLSVWTTQVDTRTPEEGGKGGTYTKPTGALPVGAKVEEAI